MAYVRKYPKRTYKRKMYKPKKVFKARVANAVRSMAEKKFNILTYVDAECDWSGRMHSYNAISQGEGQQNRISRMIQPLSVYYNFCVRNDSPTLPNIVSFIWLRDSQQKGDQDPSPTDVLTAANVGGPAAPNSLLNLNNVGRFSVLRRLTMRLAINGTDSNCRIVKGYIKLRPGHNIRYNGTATTDIEKNGIYLLIISSGNPVDDDVKITGETRLCYTDL